MPSLSSISSASGAPSTSASPPSPSLRRIKAGLTLMSSADWLAAASDLLIGDQVEALEWSWDTETPHAPWALGLVDHFASQGALYGHGVMYSPFSAEFEPRQREALKKTSVWTQLPRAAHITEHVGFMTIVGMRRGAPLPAPPCRASITAARDQLHRLADAVGRPVGLENLAMAISRTDVALQGDIIEELLAADDAPFVLDVHNLYCQAVNFSLPPRALLHALPLHRVREIHVSGGRMHALPNGVVRRRDTHDHLVPAEVWELLAASLPHCPHLEVVMLERLAGTLSHSPADLALDFSRMKQIIAAFTDAQATAPVSASGAPSVQPPVAATAFKGDDVDADSPRGKRYSMVQGPSAVAALRDYQHALVGALSASPPTTPFDASVIRAALRERAPDFSAYIQTIDDSMLAIAHAAFSRWAK